MNLSDESSNSVNNHANNYAYSNPSYIEAFRTAVSLPPPLFGNLNNNIVSNIENENEELREQMYEFNNTGNYNNANNNSFEDLTVDKPDIFRNINFNIIGVGSITRDEKTKAKTKIIKGKTKRKKKIIKNKVKKTKSHSYNKEKEKIKIKQLIEQEEDIKKLHQKDFNCIVNNKRKRKSEIKENINISSVLKKKTKKKKNNYKINEEIFKSEATFHLHHRKIRKKILKENSKTNKQNNVTIHKFDEDENNGLKTSKILENIGLKKYDDYPLHFKIERDCIKNIEQLEKNDGLISPMPFLINRKIAK